MIAASAPPPAPRTAVDANWAAPAKTIAENTIAAPAPITGSATTPKETPTQPRRDRVRHAGAHARPQALSGRRLAHRARIARIATSS